jgi:ParB-like chromosome segregation protein Spo0J
VTTTPVIQNTMIKLADLAPHPSNYRTHPESQIQDLMASLLRFGQVKSIVIQEGPHPLCVAGHGIVEAARRLNYSELRADVIPADWSPADVKGYLIADNQHAANAIDDEAILANLLQEQHDLGLDLAAIGADNDLLHDMLAKLNPPTLDELTAQYGDEPDEDAFWPVIRVKVSPETKALYDSLMEEAEGTDEGAKFANVLERVNMADEVEV